MDHHERREQIASALMRVAAAQGLEAVSLRHVATEAGVTSGMVQHYFPSKDAMMAFAMRSAGERYEARMDRAVAGLGDDPSARDVVGAMLSSLLPLDESQRADARVALAFHSYAAVRRRAAQGLDADNARLRDFITGLITQSWTTDGTSGAVDPAAAATALLAVAEGLGVQVLSAGLSPEAAVAALRAQLDLVFGRPARG